MICLGFVYTNNNITASLIFKLSPERYKLTEELCFFFFQVESTAEGEAQRYFDHALTLKNTILFLRYNKELTQDQGPDIPNIGILVLNITHTEYLLTYYVVFLFTN